MGKRKADGRLFFLLPGRTGEGIVHPIVLIQRAKRIMAALIAWLIGLFFLGIGLWILLLRSEDLIDKIKPHNMLIGQMTIDGVENKSYAELLRARFDHHFRHLSAIPKETGFFEVLSLDTTELFQQDSLSSPLKNMTIEVSGVNVSLLFRLVNQIAQPARWVVEGDFQVKSDRALLALRMRRGERLIRTWYLERLGNTAEDKSLLLEQLVDDAIFQLAYDFGNELEEDTELKKWRDVLPLPTQFPNRKALTAYYEGRSALGRFFSYGEWHDLDRAVNQLRELRSQMPNYQDGLMLLGIALAEKRYETEAIHVFQHLLLLIAPNSKGFVQLPLEQQQRYLATSLLKATATAKQNTWQTNHEAIAELESLIPLLDSVRQSAKNSSESTSITAEKKKALNRLIAHCEELKAQTAAQLAMTYSQYFSYLHRHTVYEMFFNATAPPTLRIERTSEAEILLKGPANKAKELVIRTLGSIQKQYAQWLSNAGKSLNETSAIWNKLEGGPRRQNELRARLRLAEGYTQYRIADFENHENTSEPLLGLDYSHRISLARAALQQAEAAHPNHYLVLQLLGSVYSTPRNPEKSLGIAEQYIERAILANPNDYYGHTLLAEIWLQRIAFTGIDLESRPLIERALQELQTAVALNEPCGRTQLLRAQFYTLLLELERSGERQKELRASRDRAITQASRLLPYAFKRKQPEENLSWIKIIAATRQLGKAAEDLQQEGATPEELQSQRQLRFERSKQEIIKSIDSLIKDCETLKERWVAQQRVFMVKKLEQRVKQLKQEIEYATLENWRDITIEIL